MTDRPAAPPNCTHPALGGMVHDYVEGLLEPDRQREFEEHYFACPACVKEIQTLQSLAMVSDRMKVRRPGLWFTFVAAGLAAGVAGVLLLSPNPQPPITNLRLHQVTRGTPPPSPSVGKGASLELSLGLVGGRQGDLTYDVEITDPSGNLVFKSSGLSPAENGDVQIALGAGLNSAGRYDVKVTEADSPPGEPARHYFFEVTEP